MAKHFDVLILTAYGQGYRLARDLAFEGRRVAWLDLSTYFGAGTRETMGPFCSAIHPDATDLDRREFLQDHDLMEIHQGFTVLHKGQLLESRGEISDFQQKLWDQPQAFEFLRSYSKDLKGPQWHHCDASFSKNWFLYLSTYFNKAFQELTPEGLNHQKSLHPVFQANYLPLENYSSRKKREQDLKVFGVEIVSTDEFQFRKNLEGEGFSFCGDGGALFEAKEFVHFLTGANLRSLDPTFYSQVYQEEPLEAEWHWQRMTVRMDAKMTTEMYENTIPNWMLCLEHWDLPWLEENMLILKKDPMTRSWDVWAKVKTGVYQSNSDGDRYRERLKGAVEKILNLRLGSESIEVGFEQSLRARRAQIRFEPFPIYPNVSQGRESSAPGFYACGVDALGSFDLYDRHREQKKVYQKLQRRLNP